MDGSDLSISKHQIEMMMDRGYAIPDAEMELLDLSDIEVWVKMLGYTRLDCVYHKTSNPDFTTGVYYRLKQKDT